MVSSDTPLVAGRFDRFSLSHFFTQVFRNTLRIDSTKAMPVLDLAFAGGKQGTAR
jgi:hypothetical protein